MARSKKEQELDRLALILYQAAAEPIGLLLSTNDAARARQRLYQARARCADPALANLQFRFSPWAENQLLITKGAPAAQEGEAE